MAFYVGIALVSPMVSVQAADKNPTPADQNLPAGGQDAMMMQMQKYSTPGADHLVLVPLAGKWTYTARSWMKPGDKVQVSTATEENSWVLGGRFLKQEFKGNWNGQPFEGLGYIGYDNIRQEYQSVWMDNFATGLMQVKGVFSPASKTLSEIGEFSCPLTGEKNRWVHSEWKINSDDSNTYTSYFKGPNGKEFKSMEIVYKRVK